MTILECRYCKSRLDEPLVDLGEQPLANALVTRGQENLEQRFPLVVRVCPSCHLVQADHTIPKNVIFDSEYVYFSSYSKSWVEHAKRFSEEMIAGLGLDKNSMVVEVASNDGYLLQHFKSSGVPVLGIEPTSNTAAAAIARGVDTEIAFFGRDTAERLHRRGMAADLMIANNVLAHVPELGDFISGFGMLLKPEGVVTFEFPHLLNLLENVQFDTIYHEHFSYLSLGAVQKMLSDSGLKIFDVACLPTHGGSLRVFAARNSSNHSVLDSVRDMRARESRAGLDEIDSKIFSGFSQRVCEAKQSFIAFLDQAKSESKKVAAYGAAAKGNTFLNFCQVNSDDIICVADASHAKQGKLLPGSHIPIVPPAALSEVKPDYLVILPWNLEQEIRGSMAHVQTWGGQFVAAIPTTRILS